MAKNVDSGEESKIQWLYPELMTEEGLIAILKQRYVNKHGLRDMEKEELLELYYKYILPLPQRKYRQNRRGREMTKKQIIMAKKRKTSETDESEPVIKKQFKEFSEEPAARFSCSTTLSEKGDAEDRLKPPPSCINFERKSIKLASSSSSDSTTEETPKSEEKTKKGFTKITFSSTSADSVPLASESASKSRPHVDANKTLQLINKHIKFSDNNENESKKPKKKDDSLDFEIKTFVKKDKPLKTEETSDTSNGSKSEDGCMKKRQSDSQLLQDEPKVEEVKKKKIKIKRISF